MLLKNPTLFQVKTLFYSLVQLYKDQKTYQNGRDYAFAKVYLILHEASKTSKDAFNKWAEIWNEYYHQAGSTVIRYILYVKLAHHF